MAHIELTEEELIRDAELYEETNGAHDELPATTTTVRKKEDGEKKKKQCAACGSSSVIQRIEETFGERVCYKCVTSNEDFKSLSKAKAKEAWVLNDEQIAKLKFEIKRSTKQKFYADVHLYLVKHLRETAMKVWGSMENLEAERERREEVKTQRRRSLQSKRAEERKEEGKFVSGNEMISEQISKQRRTLYSMGEAGSPTTTTTTTTSDRKRTKKSVVLAVDEVHFHVFEEDVVDPQSGEVIGQKCTTCGKTVTVKWM